MSNVIVVSAHPDDMEIGMGGTAAKLTDQGHALTSIVLTNGRRSPNPFQLSVESLVELRQQEARKAAALLGISDIIFCNLDDLSSSKNYERARSQVAKTISMLRPSEVYILHPELDRHPSHQLSGKAVLEALRETQQKAVTVWAYEVWGLFSRWDRFEDISNYIGRKIQSISEHRTQVACIPYQEGIMGLNRWRAIFADPSQSSIVAAFAEVFIRYPVQDV